MQKTAKDTCGIFQLYFYEELFGPQYDNVVLSHETLKNTTVQTLLNQTFFQNKDTNKRIFEEYIVNKNIKFGWCAKKTYSRDNFLMYLDSSFWTGLELYFRGIKDRISH